MDKILAPIKQRVIQLVDYKKINKEKFFRDIAVSASNFRSKSLYSEVGGDVLAKILSHFPDVNPTWLLTGKGPMFQNQNHSSYFAETEAEYKTEKRYPLVEPKAVGGFGSANFSISERDIKEYYVVPKFQHKVVDFMIEVEGSSMYPKYNSGDVVACRMLHESTFIQWNKTHVIATKYQGILIKRIKPSERSGFYTLVSDNKDYPPFEVPVDEIDGIALVVGVIRLE